MTLESTVSAIIFLLGPPGAGKTTLGSSCRLVYVDGFVIDEQATAVSWDEDGAHVTLHAGTAPPRVTLEEKMIAIVDPDSGETTAHPELPDAIDPALRVRYQS
jgi:hypothetical protein